MKKYRMHIFPLLLLVPAVLLGGCAAGYTIFKGIDYREFKPPAEKPPESSLPSCKPDIETATAGKLKMDIYLPKPFDRNKQYSGVLFLIGCGWAKPNLLNGRHDWLSHGVELARRGYICFAIDYRVAPEFFYPAPNEDSQYALDLITGKASPEFISRYCNPLRDVGIAGFSSGGNIAALMGTGRSGDNRKNVRCIAVYAGLMDVRKTAEIPKKSRKTVEDNYLYGKTEAVHAEASPICSANKAFCPFLLQWGKDDTWVPVAQAEAMYAALQQQGITVEKRFYDSGPHGFQFVDIENGPAARNHTVNFIGRHLPPPH